MAKWARGSRGVLLVCVALVLTSCLEAPPQNGTQVGAGAPETTEAPNSASEVTELLPTSEPTRPAAVDPLLRAAGGGDGDSWKDTSGREYRLGLVNTPETNECYGSAATAKRTELVAGGFRAQVYETDTYGRSVAVVTTARGVNLNVWLARHGYANDRYLAEFRHENASLAAQLDRAFAAAKAEGAGLWSACAARPLVASSTKRPATSRSGCDPSYPTVCIPPPPPDLDCGDISHRRFEVVGDDPHRFDADGDGVGCESG